MLIYSFVIPVYNCRPYLEECVGSIQKQTVSNFEILLVDDGSSDGSGELCDELAKRDGRIRVFHKENGGAGSARNLGIEMSRGQYLLFIDGDDTIEPDSLELIEPIVNGGKCLPIFGMSFDYWSEGQIEKRETHSTAFPGERSVGEVAETFEGFFEDNALSSACNKVFPVKLLRENGLRFSEDMLLYEDLTFVLECLPYFERVHVIDKPLYHYRNLVEKEHFKSRICDVDTLRENLKPLNRVFCEFGKKMEQEEKTATASANLYLMLLDLNLMHSKSGVNAESEKLTAYVWEENFRHALRTGAVLDSEKQRLLNLIEKKRFMEIRKIYLGKKVKAYLRRTVKRLLGR